jgi:catechol 2,3-dioxygenase-like lactoylglutathione lyase family enzyme
VAGKPSSPGEKQVSNQDLRPPLWIGHVVLETDRLEESAQFMHTIGMRGVYQEPGVAIFELRGGTHLVLTEKSGIVPADAPFDLMVEDLHATHQRFTSLGLAPSPIEAMSSVDHEFFRIREPAGHRITFYSNHVSGHPV